MYRCDERLKPREIGDYYETIKRELNKRLIYECWCDERLRSRVEGSTCLGYTGLHEGLEPLEVETKIINERFPSSSLCLFIMNRESDNYRQDYI
jgi:hypothetical protein